MSLKQLQNMLDNKAFDPLKLSNDQVNQMDQLFESGQLKGYKNTRELMEERKSAAEQLAIEAERADRPIETFTRENLPVFGEVNRTTFESVGDIFGSIMGYVKDRDKLKKYFTDNNYRQRFGIAYPTRFLDSVAAMKATAAKVAKKSAPGRAFFSLTGFLNRVEDSGKNLLKTGKRLQKYGVAQPLKTEAKSIGLGAAGAAVGSATYDIADFAAELTANSQVDLSTISDNDLDSMSLPERLVTKSLDAGVTSLAWGAGATGLFGMTGRLIRSFGKGLTGTGNPQAKILAAQASKKGLPLSLAAVADEDSTFGKLAGGFGKVFGVLPFVNSRIIQENKKFQQKVVQYYGDYLATLGPIGYADLLGKEFQDTVKKQHAKYLTMTDAVYKNLENIIKPMSDIKFVPTKNLRKMSKELKDEYIANTPGGREVFERDLADFTAGKIKGFENPMFRTVLRFSDPAFPETVTLGQFQQIKRDLNAALQQEGKGRMNLLIRDARNAMDIDLDSVASEENIGKLFNNETFKTKYANILQNKGKAAADKFRDNTLETVGTFKKRLDSANEFYSRVISPYNEGILQKLAKKSDANLFTSLGELNVAGNAVIEPEKLFREVGNVVFRDGTDRTIRELKTLVGYDQGEQGKKLFNAMRSRFVFDAYIKSFTEPRTFLEDELVSRIGKMGGDSAVDSLMLKKDPRLASQAAGFRSGQVQTSKTPVNEIIDINSLGDFNFANFKKELGLGVDDELTKRRLYEIFGDGDIKKGIAHVQDMDKVLDVLQAHYGNVLGDTSTFLARRAGLGGMAAMTGGVAGFSIASGGGGVIAALLPTYLLRRLGGFLNNADNTKALLDIYTTGERKDMLIKNVVDRKTGEVVGERYRTSMLEPLGKGLSPRKRQSLQRVLQYLNEEEEDFPGTNPMKVTGEDIRQHLLKIEAEKTPVIIPDEPFDPAQLPPKNKAHLYPEVYRMEKMDVAERSMYNDYLNGNRKAARDYNGLIQLEIENAARTEPPEIQQPAQVAQGLPQVPPMGQQQTGPTYQQLFPNDELGVGIDMRNA